MKDKETEAMLRREQAVEYALLVDRLLLDKELLSKVVGALQTKNADALEDVFKDLKVPKEMKEHVKKVMFTQPVAALMW
jgi:hypothetical protein